MKFDVAIRVQRDCMRCMDEATRVWAPRGRAWEVGLCLSWEWRRRNWCGGSKSRENGGSVWKE